jgi:hypothetical protein
MVKFVQRNKIYEKAIKNWPVDDRPRDLLHPKGAKGALMGR